MSIRVLNEVWRRSRSNGSALLVLLAIADFADDSGIAFPSVPTLARKARISERHAQRMIQRLKTLGELHIRRGQGRKGSHLYQVIICQGDIMSGVTSETKGVTSDPPGGDTGVTQTVIEPSEEPSSLKSTIKGDTASPSMEQAFNEFWKAYPARNGKKVERGDTLNRFKKLSPQERMLVVQAAKNFAASERVRAGFGIKDPKRFIRDGNRNEPWRDWIEPEQAAHGKTSSYTGFGRRDYRSGTW